MFIFSVTSVEANRSVFNAINPEDGEVVELKYLPKNVGFDDWSKYDEVRIIDKFEIDFGVIVPVVFAVDRDEVAEARVLIVEAL